jgi:hypothetical protein
MASTNQKIMFLKRLSLFIIFFILMIHNCYPQKITTMSTKELLDMTAKVGLDSVLHYIQYSPSDELIYWIDSLTIKKLILLDSNMEYMSWSFQYFVNIAQIIKDEKLSKKLLDFYNDYKYMLLFGRIKQWRLDKDFINGLIYQNHYSLRNQLKEDFNFWEEISDETLKNCPESYEKLYFSLTSVEPPCKRNLDQYKSNIYAMAWMLNKLGDTDFIDKKMVLLNKDYEDYYRYFKLGNRKSEHKIYDTTIIELSKPINSITELNILEEKELWQIICTFKYEDKSCWVFRLDCEKFILIDIGCMYGPLVGEGYIYKIELIEPQKLIIYKIGGWIS